MRLPLLLAAALLLAPIAARAQTPPPSPTIAANVYLYSENGDFAAGNVIAGPVTTPVGQTAVACNQAKRPALPTGTTLDATVRAQVDDDWHANLACVLEVPLTIAGGTAIPPGRYRIAVAAVAASCPAVGTQQPCERLKQWVADAAGVATVFIVPAVTQPQTGMPAPFNHVQAVRF